MVRSYGQNIAIKPKKNQMRKAIYDFLIFLKDLMVYNLILVPFVLIVHLYFVSEIFLVSLIFIILELIAADQVIFEIRMKDEKYARYQHERDKSSLYWKRFSRH